MPIICIDARHASAALKMRPVKTDRNDAAGLAQIVRTGWFNQLVIKSRNNYQIRSLLTAREMLARIRVKIENELRGLLRTFGVLFGRRVGSFADRPGEIISGELDASPEMRLVAETLMKARTWILAPIKVLNRRPSAVARATPMVRLFVTGPSIAMITSLRLPRSLTMQRASGVRQVPAPISASHLDAVSPAKPAVTAASGNKAISLQEYISTRQLSHC